MEYGPRLLVETRLGYVLGSSVPNLDDRREADSLSAQISQTYLSLSAFCPSWTTASRFRRPVSHARSKDRVARPNFLDLAIEKIYVGRALDRSLPVTARGGHG